MIKDWKNGLWYDTNHYFYKLYLINGLSFYIDIRNNLGLIPIAVGNSDVELFTMIDEDIYMEHHVPLKESPTLEGLGFKIVKTIDGYKFKGWRNIYGQHITIFVNKIREPDIWGVHYYYHEGAEIPQELHKAVELKMIELGLWEE